ncbi:hypothetical protein GCM10023321_80530 [Pseudonocardia eucalypti]|uniref:Uncharacterized protein n=1 Tax=Pseudonocardia eucalypti TaxID=648755 RepID=A0ABP9RCJ1_9PSEU
MRGRGHAPVSVVADRARAVSMSSVVGELASILDRPVLSGSDFKAVDVIGRLLVAFPSELVTLEREHLDRAGVCSHCPDAQAWPCGYVRCAWDARLVLGWPLPGAAREWAGHA